MQDMVERIRRLPGLYNLCRVPLYLKLACEGIDALENLCAFSTPVRSLSPSRGGQVMCGDLLAMFAQSWFDKEHNEFVRIAASESESLNRVVGGGLDNAALRKKVNCPRVMLFCPLCVSF